MKLFNKKRLFVALLSLTMLLVACSNGKNNKNNESKNETVVETKNEKVESSKETKAESKATTVEIEDNKGKQTVPVNSKSVVVLDSRAFQTIEDWGIKVKAAPKAILPVESKIKSDESIKDLGNHREPKFELLAAENPEVVIVGQRFAQHYDTIKKLLPNAVVLNIDINLKSENPGKALVEGLKRNTEILGKVFNKENEAKDLIAKFDAAVKSAKDKKTDKKFAGLIVSANKIGYSAPVSGRVWGPVFTLLGLEPALKIDNASSDHKGDDISVESIAQNNPDALLVLDRDAAYGKKESKLAKDVIEGSQVLEKTKALKNGKVFYAPKETYANESIQTWTKIFTELAQFMAK